MTILIIMKLAIIRLRELAEFYVSKDHQAFRIFYALKRRNTFYKRVWRGSLKFCGHIGEVC